MKKQSFYKIKHIISIFIFILAILILYQRINNANFDTYYLKALDPWSNAFFYLETVFAGFLGLISLIIVLLFYVKEKGLEKFIYIILLFFTYVIAIIYPFVLFYQANKKVSLEFKNGVAEINNLITCIDNYKDITNNLPKSINETNCVNKPILIQRKDIKVIYELEEDENNYTIAFSTGWYYHKYYSRDGQWFLFQD